MRNELFAFEKVAGVLEACCARTRRRTRWLTGRGLPNVHDALVNPGATLARNVVAFFTRSFPMPRVGSVYLPVCQSMRSPAWTSGHLYAAVSESVETSG